MPEELRIVYFGSPGFSADALRVLAAEADFRLAAVVTQPDRPAGRGRRLQQPAVKTAAAELGLPVLQPRSVRKRSFLEAAGELQADFFAVFAYGKILPPALLATPRIGCVNLHLSLLPRYRGAAPVAWALVNGDRATGVTTMLMDEGMDTGPILLQREYEIGASETAVELTGRLAQAGAPLLTETLRLMAQGKLEPRAQEDAQATRAPLIRKEDGLVDWRWDAATVCNRWRGLQPWPGIFTLLGGSPLKLISVRQADEAIEKDHRPGTITVSESGLFVACSAGTALELLQVQQAGRKPVCAADFVNGARLRSGQLLGA